MQSGFTYTKYESTDVNGDGYADFLGINPAQPIVIWENNKLGGFYEPFPTELQVFDFEKWLIGDFDGDGMQDFAGRTYDTKVLQLQEYIDGDYNPAQFLASGFTYDNGWTGKFTSDNRADIVIRDKATNKFYLYPTQLVRPLYIF